MWPSDSGNSRRQSASSSSSSSAIPQSPRRTTMEEVWKDINLATLGHKSTTVTAGGGRHTVRGVILQDFLAGAFKDPPSSAAGDLPQLPLPPTALTLSSPAGFRPGPRNSTSDSNFPRHITVGSSSPSSAAAGDRRHKRVIRNRESAARSRARKQALSLSLSFSLSLRLSFITENCEAKQAYTNELELEVAQLAEENAKLRKQNEELRLAMAAQLPKARNVLQRTSSAPF